MERPFRSQKYQSKFKETPFDFHQAPDFWTSDRFTELHSNNDYSEEFRDLNEQVVLSIMKIIEINLTEIQRKIVLCIMDGYTQTETGKLLNLNQSTIAKSIHGNTDYKHNYKSYGGAFKKIRKEILKSKEIKNILKKMEELC